MTMQERSEGENGIRILFFDLGRVILDYDRMRFIRALAKRIGVPVPPEAVYERYRNLEILKAFDRGDVSPEEFFEKIKALVGLDMSFDEFVPIWCDIFEPIPEMVELVKKLAEKYPLYLLSNINRLHADYVKKRYSDIINLFRGLVFSCDIRMLKTEPGFFIRALATAGDPPPSACLFVDDVEEHVRVAESLGIRGVVFDGRADGFAEKLRGLGVRV